MQKIKKLELLYLNKCSTRLPAAKRIPKVYNWFQTGHTEIRDINNAVFNKWGI